MTISEKIKDLLNQLPRFKVAYEIAEDAHSNVCRKDGKTPYMRHIDAVITNTHTLVIKESFNNSYPLDYFLVVAALHDAYEDNRETFSLEILRNKLSVVFSDYALDIIIPAIDAISKKPKGTEQYAQYVIRLLGNFIASVVKLGDLEHNMSDLSHGSMRDKYSLTEYILKKELKITT